VGMMASVVGAFYYLRLIKIMWFDEAKETSFVTMRLELRLVLALSGMFALFYVFFGYWISPLAHQAALSLF